MNGTPSSRLAQRVDLGPIVPLAWLTVTGAILAVFATVTAQVIGADGFGRDYGFYRDVGARWLADGSFYLPHQLAGPYDLALMSDVLYPPSALPLFVAAALAPPVLWWAIPVGVTLCVAWQWHPSAWAVGGAMLLLAWPRAHAAFIYGNTDIWAMAAVAAGLRWGWPALLVALKPTLIPFALVGIGHRSWWIAAGVSLVVVALTLRSWLDYVTALRNVHNLGADYSLGSLPLLIVPIVLWAGRRKEARPAEAERVDWRDVPYDSASSGRAARVGGDRSDLV